eukprot:5062879-Pyramimonas_sp.AAC.1
MQDGIKFCWYDNGVLLSEGNIGVIEPCYISHVEDLATGKHWRNPEYLGDRRVRVPPAVLSNPGRWADVGSAS